MWVLPTLGRPHRLARFALSWEKCEPGRPLIVKLYKDDPERKVYENTEWPEGWEFHISDIKFLGPSLNELWKLHPDERTYGFLADDIILRTPGGLQRLEDLAEDSYVAFPNDMIQRHALCTHFCVGREVTKALGWWVHPSFIHDFIDTTLGAIAVQCGMLRYAPDVIFQHMHFLADERVMDKTYEDMIQHQQMGRERFEVFLEGELPALVKKMQMWQKKRYEFPDKWESDDRKGV